MYPQGPSVQFYKMYLDENVRKHLKEYEVLAIIEWDVLVAHETSFEQLYYSAFQGEPFWVKGSVLGEPLGINTKVESCNHVVWSSLCCPAYPERPIVVLKDRYEHLQHL